MRHTCGVTPIAWRQTTGVDPIGHATATENGSGDVARGSEKENAHVANIERPVRSIFL